MDNIGNVVKSKKCTGCGSCLAVCPKECITLAVQDGFFYPVIDERECINCGKCHNVCAALNYKELEQKAIAWKMAYAKDDNMPENSTSGGICTVMSKMCMDNGYNVFAACFDDDWTLSHRMIKDESELEKFAGSKYMQSMILPEAYREIKDSLCNNRPVLFVGTSCQVVGLKNYLSAENVSMEHLLTIDFLCHGMPSPLVGQEYIKSLEKNKGEKISNYNFRSKDKGWGKHRRSITYESGKRKSIRSDMCPLQLWFGLHFSIRHNCFECQFRTEDRPADITVADFWKISNYYPEVPTEQGVSAVQVNSESGERALDELAQTDTIVIKDVSYDSIWGHRVVAKKNYPKPSEYNEFWDTYKSGGVEALIKKYPPLTYWGRIKSKLLSMIKR